MPKDLTFELQSDFGYLPFLTQLSNLIAPKRGFALAQVLVELFNNAVVHGSKKEKKIWIKISIRVHNKKIQLKVADRGRGFEWKKSVPLPKYQTHGRGLEIIRHLARKITHRKIRSGHEMEVVIDG